MIGQYYVKFSDYYVNRQRSYTTLNLENWMCVGGGFSQIRSHM